MSDFLHTVIKERLSDVQAASREVPITALQQQAAAGGTRRSLIARLLLRPETNARARIIGEVKKASPSAGLLCERYQPGVIAAEYERCGAVGISVLTEPRHFLGSNEDLREVRNAVDLPVLRKDFICDPYQVYESAALGADVVLLIGSALDHDRLREFYEIALSVGLETIIEVHTRKELETALPLAKCIIGVNSRNLKTLKTDLSAAKKLAALLPPDRVAIAESGIRTRKEIEELQALGYRGFLVGESLMKSADIKCCLRGLIG